MNDGLNYNKCQTKNVSNSYVTCPKYEGHFIERVPQIAVLLECGHCALANTIDNHIEVFDKSILFANTQKTYDSLRTIKIGKVIAVISNYKH